MKKVTNHAFIHIVFKFQFDRDCFQRGEAIANFSVIVCVSNAGTTVT